MNSEIGAFDRLTSEQAEVQKEKFQGRLLEEYNYYLFPGSDRNSSSSVAELLRSHTTDEKPSLQTLLTGIQRNISKPATWIEMGGGRALAMRQIALDPDIDPRTKMINVDLFDYGLDGLSDEELHYLEQHYPNVTDSITKPTTLLANIETVALDEKPQLITSVEVLQYLDDPMNALTNWYNQLDDDGVMIVATEHSFGQWIRYENTQARWPMEAFTEALTEHGITHAYTDTSDYYHGGRENITAERMRTLAIQKKPNTTLTPVHAPTKVWTNFSHFKAAYYPEACPIKITSSERK